MFRTHNVLNQTKSRVPVYTAGVGLCAVAGQVAMGAVATGAVAMGAR